MTWYFAVILSLSLTQFTVAQDKLCNAASGSIVERQEGVITEQVTLSGKWGSNKATVYLPDKEIAEGGIVFSHSSIRSDDAITSLFPFALMLAHGGAAVIVPERQMVWLPSGHMANREGEVVICAEHWLIDHTTVFNNGEPTINAKNTVVREGYGYVGPRICDPTVPDQCSFMDPFVSEDCALKRYCRHSVWVPLGETEGGDNTTQIISDRGLHAAGWLQRNLGLAPIKQPAIASAEN